MRTQTTIENPLTVALNRENPKALRALHAAMGYDFQKPMRIYRIEGKFTLAQITKVLGEDHSTKQNRIVLLVKPPYNPYNEYRNRLHLVRLKDACTDFDVEIKGVPFASNIETWYRKSDFNDARKSARYVWIFYQSNEYLHYMKPNEPPQIYRRYFGDLYDKHYYKPWTRIETDKSGYPVELKRNELKAGAKALRIEREKAKAAAEDFTERIETLKADAEAFRAEMISALSVPGLFSFETSQAPYELYQILKNINRIETKTINKEWWSCADVNREINNTAERLANAQKKLNETKGETK